MKQEQQTKGVAEKKPQTAGIPLMSSAATTTTIVETARVRSAFGSPSAAVWTRYIDSRMKQFGTR